LWDVQTGNCYRTLSGHVQGVNCVAVLPETQQCVSGSADTSLRIWSLSTGQCMKVLQGHVDWVSCCIVFNNDNGIRIASGSWDQTIRIWNAQTGKCKMVLSGHTHHVSSLAVSTLGWILYSSSWDTTIKVWNLATQNCIHTLQGHTDAVTDMALFYNHDQNKMLVSVSRDRSIKLWDGETYQCLSTLKDAHEDGITCCTIFDNNRRLLTGSEDNTLRIWNLTVFVNSNKKKQPRQLPNEPGLLLLLYTIQGHQSMVFCCRVFDQDRQIVSGSSDNTLKGWVMAN
jgi:WD40 repeat protein